MGALMGVSAYWVAIGEVFGVAIAWFFMAEKFKSLTDQYQSVTIPDYLVSRFQPKTNTLRIVAATALSVFVVIYVSAQIDTTGQAFESFLGWDYYTGALTGFFIVLAYIFSGGFIAVAWSDLFQGILMFLGLVVLPIGLFFSIDAPSEIMNGLAQIDPSLMQFSGPTDDWIMNLCIIGGFMMIGLGFLGSPQVFVRFMSIKDLGEIKKGRWVAIVFTLLTDIAAVSIGILGRYIFTQIGEAPEVALGNGAEKVFSVSVEYLMPEIIIGGYIAVVLSAIMSTIDSLLVVASSAVTRDFYQQIYKPKIDEKQLASLSRKVTIVLALFALGVAMLVANIVPGRTVFWFVIFGWSGIAATFCPAIILSLFWNRFTEKGALASMIVGFLSVPLFKFGLVQLPGIGPYIKELDVLGPPFLVAIIAGVLVSKLENKKA
jgi:sodium/proline symporter